MLSDRTAKYAEAMAREGKDFDYWKWLRRIQQEDARTKTVPAPVEPGTPGSGHATTAQVRGTFGNVGTAGNNKTPPVPREVIPRCVAPAKDVETPKKSLRQRLGNVSDAWDRFQEDRNRDAVYGYLRAVFSIVRHYKRKGTDRLVIRAFKFAGLPVDRNADVFAVVIRATCDGEADNKTISKWSRALRYAARVKKPHHPLTTFMKNRGGVNGCAEQYAKYFGRGGR
jgi:hypothetical protein